MTAKTSWMRVTALALAIVLASAPSAFAGRLLDSALEAAAEVTARKVVAPEGEAAIAGSLVRPGQTRPAAVQDPAGQGDRGRGAGRLWAVIGAGVGIALAMMVIDRKVEDSTPSTRRERRDGCTLFCS